jgi:hypothetical protein
MHPRSLFFTDRLSPGYRYSNFTIWLSRMAEVVLALSGLGGGGSAYPSVPSGHDLQRVRYLSLMSLSFFNAVPT